MRKQVLLETGNKNTRVNEAGQTCFFHPTRNKWLPGHYDGKRFVWVYNPARFYDRPRPYRMPDGSTKRVRATRYTYGLFRKYDAAPKGKTGRTYKVALKECAHTVYYDGERFWQGMDVLLEDGTWFNHTIVPFNGEMWDSHPAQSEEQGIPVLRIWCEDGKAVKVEMDGEEFDVHGDWDMYQSLLMLRGA